MASFSQKWQRPKESTKKRNLEQFFLVAAIKSREEEQKRNKWVQKSVPKRWQFCTKEDAMKIVLKKRRHQAEWRKLEGGFRIFQWRGKFQEIYFMHMNFCTLYIIICVRVCVCTYVHSNTYIYNTYLYMWIEFEF